MLAEMDLQNGVPFKIANSGLEAFQVYVRHRRFQVYVRNNYASSRSEHVITVIDHRFRCEITVSAHRSGIEITLCAHRSGIEVAVGAHRSGIDNVIGAHRSGIEMVCIHCQSIYDSLK